MTIDGLGSTSAPNLKDLPAVLTVDEAAAYLRVGRSAAYAAIKAGQIPAIRLGRKIRVSREALARLVEGEANDLAG